nr:PREDICTED: putative odorant-binding protein A5 isoform X2 [Bemisia tabaci]
MNRPRKIAPLVCSCIGLSATFRHIIITMCHGTDYVRGETIVEYREPIPLQGTGLHRYVFLAFPQGNRTINVTMPKLEYCNVTQRLHFDLRRFGKKYNLGEPNAANFFVAQWHRVTSHNESIST